MDQQQIQTEIDNAKLARQTNQILGDDAWRLTPATMAHELSQGQWIPARHLQIISAHIASTLAHGNGRLLVSIPPRHGKSLLLAVWTAVWALDRNPSTEIILASYGAELAQDHSRMSRDIILECQRGEGIHKLNVTIRRDSTRVDRYLTTKGGGLRAVGIGGAVSGRGADLFLLDDYLKNPKEAASESIRKDIFEWFASVAFARLSPNASIIILATRWNISDLIGQLKDLGSEYGKLWDMIELPAIALKDDPIHRKPGEALWPERYNKKRLDELKNLMGNYLWQAEYQQKPIPRSGNQVAEENFHVVDIVPKRLDLIRSWDLAATADDGDFSCGMLMGRDPKTKLIYVLDRKRGQWSPAATEEMVKTTAECDGHDVRILMEQEGGAAGKSVISHYARNVVSGYAFEGLRPSGDKFVRAQPYLAGVQNDLVHLQRGSWNRTYMDEVVLFPDADHDDQVDCSSQAYNRLTQKSRGSVVFGRGSAQSSDVIRGSGDRGIIVSGATFGRSK